MRVSNWFRLLRLARRRFVSDADYVRFQALQAEMILAELEEHGVCLRGKRILDLGCGEGGYSVALAKKTDWVVAVDRYVVNRVRGSKAMWPTQADALALPFGDGQFDFVMCASLIEHVPDAPSLLKEIRRVLSLQGVCYLSFPPFYSPVGGHQFKPYHLLGEKMAIRLAGFNVEAYENAYEQWGLYRRTIGEVRRLVKDAGLSIQNMSTRFLPMNFAAWPVLGEFLTWHVQFILTRSEVEG